MKSNKPPRKKIHRALAGAAVLCFVSFAATSFAVGTRRIELRSAEELKGGDLKGVAIDSAGRIRPGFNLGGINLPEGSSTVWSALQLDDGSVLLGTGNEGKLFSGAAGQVKLVGETGALAITSLVKGWGGDVYMATLPDGEIWQYTGGKLSKFVALKDVQHVWGLAFDAKANVLYAATGPDGKLFRVDKAGNAQVYFDAEEQHLMSVALHEGKVFAGASDKAKLYEVTAPGRARVFYDFGRTEVRSVVAGKDGDLFAIANEIKAGSYTPDRKPKAAAAPVSRPAATKGKGTLYRFSKDGTPEQLLDDGSEHFVSLAVDVEGRPYVGTGAEGRIYTVDENHNSVLVADTEERQVGALVLGKGKQYVATSDPPMFREIRGVGGADAVWTSKVLDLGLRARFGRVTWSSDGKVEVSTRSGNSNEPDDTWSAWSNPMLAPAVATSPPARFLQVRARFNQDKKAVLSDLTIPFVTDNLRAVITSVDAGNTGGGSVTDGSGGVQSSGGPVDGSPGDKVNIKWDVDNPDKDELRYRLEYRLVGTTHWYPMLEPNEVLTKASYTWETGDLPEGQYRVRVFASDELSNPPGSVTRHQLESEVVLVDNTAPTIRGLAVAGRVVRGVAVDGVGPIQRIEVSEAGSGIWVPFHPKDGIFDEQSEDFEIDASSISPRGRAMLILRVFDQANNSVVRHVTLK